MPWDILGFTNAEVVEHLREQGIISSPNVVQAMLNTDRRRYTPFHPYDDAPQPIGCKAYASAPHMHGYALQLLSTHLHEGASALDIGCGSGYLTVCMAQMVGPTGKVVGVDHMPEIVNSCIKRVKLDKPELLESGQLKFVVGDGRYGYLPDAPYDAIHVGAAVPEVKYALIDQLKIGGRMLVPVGPLGDQRLEQCCSSNGFRNKRR